MIDLGYSLDPSWNRTLAQLDLRTVNQTALSYDLFLGDVYMRIDDADFSARWRWVPVLDFAVCLKAVVENLSDGRHDRFQFTESDSEIRFERRGETVQVSANYVPDVASVPYTALLEAVRAFADRVLADLALAYPALKENPEFQQLQRQGRWWTSNHALPVPQE